MAALISRDEIIKIVSKHTRWMVGLRMEKLRSELHTSMSMNPFLAPVLYDLHHASNFGDLADLLLAGHLMTGHNTSFGKLIDEKILPDILEHIGAKKLTGQYRAANPPLNESCFDRIDHLIPASTAGQLPALLSLKAGRWTIQLESAVGLNAGFAEIDKKHGKLYSEIVVGVFYGTEGTLTDKYDILRGINRGKNHDVIDLQHKVRVLAGKAFWAWLNGGEEQTQHWILDGIIDGLEKENCSEECRKLLSNYTTAFNRAYDKYIDKETGKVDWHGLLTSING